MASVQELTQILYSSLMSPIGQVYMVSDFATARSHLYQARRKLGDPSLSRLQFRQSPEAHNELWIVKGPENEQGE